MLNKFRNAIYGVPNANDDTGLNYDNQEASKSRRVRSALTRSSSFREDLLKDLRDTVLKETDTPGGIERSGNIERSKSKALQRGSSHNGSSKNQYSNAVNSLLNDSRYSLRSSKLPKFRYSRPEFLQLKTEDEIIVSADHQIRPIILPRDITRLPWKSGYAECINAGKSLRNEDQAAAYHDVLIKDWLTLRDNNLDVDAIGNENKLPWTYFGIFDGHAGTAVAVAAATQLHTLIGEKLSQVVELLIELEFEYNNNSEHGELEDPAKSQTRDLTDTTQYSDRTSKNSEESNSESNLAEVNTSKNEIDADTKVPESDPKPPVETVIKQKVPQQKEPIESPKKISDQSMYNMNDIVRSNVSIDTLVSGALEAAFWDMDAQIARDKQEYKMAGGCAAIVGLFILGKLYVCNAGDSRAIVYKNDKVIPMSYDFTPTSERERILRLGMQQPELLGNDFTVLEFVRRPTRKDLGKQMLYKDAYMTGWAMKTITYEDLKFPLVWGEGKRSRVLATIGVTRGFGDHELRAHQGSVLIKPFLTPEPEVRVLPLEYDDELTAEDVLIMGSDGLWDVTSNQDAANTVKASLALFPDNEESSSKYRYITAAQDLVIRSRGHTTNWNSVWRTDEERLASLDDIAVFVIPLKQYKDEYVEWKKLRNQSELKARLGNGNEINDAANGARHNFAPELPTATE